MQSPEKNQHPDHFDVAGVLVFVFYLVDLFAMFSNLFFLG